MRKKNIWFLALFSAVALTALIIVQLVWIRDAVNVQEKQFDHMISQTMNEIVNKLEEFETISYLEDELVDSVLSKTISSPAETTDINKSQEISYGLGAEEDSLFMLENEDYYSLQVQRNLLSGDTMVLLPDTSIYDLSRNFNHTRSLIPQSDIRNNYDQMFSNKRVFVESVFNRMVRYDEDIEHRLPKLMLDTIIRSKMSQLHLDLKYEYGVRTARSRYTLTTPGFDPSTGEKIYTSWLYPYDIIKTPNFLVLYFPGQKNYLFKSVSFLATTSLILTMVLLIISFITIYVIIRQKKLSEIKNDFVNNMTHELKTPISTISLASQMLSDPSIETDSVKLSHISELISEESKRLGMQVEKVLQMSIFDQGKMRLNIRTIDPDQLIRQVVDKLELQLKQREARVDLDLDCKGETVKGDEVHLTNVIYNLLDNALKYTHIAPIITIRSSAIKEGVTIFIRDNGIGMSKVHCRHIFEKFYRIPTGNLHDVKGFGLGLSYVKKVVDEHEGKLSVVSELGRGSEFQVLLPFKLEKH